MFGDLFEEFAVRPVVDRRYFKDEIFTSSVLVTDIYKKEVFGLQTIYTRKGPILIDQTPKLIIWYLHSWQPYEHHKVSAFLRDLEEEVISTPPC